MSEIVADTTQRSFPIMENNNENMDNKNQIPNNTSNTPTMSEIVETTQNSFPNMEINDENVDPKPKKSNNLSPEKISDESLSGDSGHFSLSPNSTLLNCSTLNSTDTTLNNTAVTSSTSERKNLDEKNDHNNIIITKLEKTTFTTLCKKLNFSIDALLDDGQRNDHTDNGIGHVDTIINKENNGIDHVDTIIDKENNGIDHVESIIDKENNGINDKSDLNGINCNNGPVTVSPRLDLDKTIHCDERRGLFTDITRDPLYEDAVIGCCHNVDKGTDSEEVSVGDVNNRVKEMAEGDDQHLSGSDEVTGRGFCVNNGNQIKEKLCNVENDEYMLGQYSTNDEFSLRLLRTENDESCMETDAKKLSTTDNTNESNTQYNTNLYYNQYTNDISSGSSSYEIPTQINNSGHSYASPETDNSDLGEQTIEESLKGGDVIHTNVNNGDEENQSQGVRTARHNVIGCDVWNAYNQQTSSWGLEKGPSMDSRINDLPTNKSPAKTPPPQPQQQQKKKVKRTQYSRNDIQRLTHSFQQDPWLSPEKQEKLATDMGYTETQIKTWFQNKRASTFGSRRPKKRPLRELSFNQPIISPHILQAQPNIYPRPLHYSPHSQQLQEYTDQTKKRKENTDGEQNFSHCERETSVKNPSPTNASFYNDNIHINVASNIPSTASMSPLSVTTTHPTTSPYTYTYSQTATLRKDDYPYHQDGHVGLKSPDTTHKIPRYHNQPIYNQLFPASLPPPHYKPQEPELSHQPVAPMMFTSGYPPPPFPLPQHNPGMKHPSLLTHPCNSFFHPGFNTGYPPVTNDYKTAMLQNATNSHRSNPIFHRGFTPSSTNTTSERDALTTVKQEWSNPVNPGLCVANQIPLQSQNSEVFGKESVNIDQITTTQHHYMPQQEEQPSSFSAFLEEFADRLHKTANNRGARLSPGSVGEVQAQNQSVQGIASSAVHLSPHVSSTSRIHEEEEEEEIDVE